MNTRNRQNGMTLIGWLVMLALIGFLALIAIRLVPAYIEYNTIVQSMMQAHSQATPETPINEVRNSIGRRFMINDVKSVHVRDIKITRKDGNLVMELAYEYRTPMMSNVDAVVVFEKVVGDN